MLLTLSMTCSFFRKVCHFFLIPTLGYSWESSFVGDWSGLEFAAWKVPKTRLTYLGCPLGGQLKIKESMLELPLPGRALSFRNKPSCESLKP